MKHNQVDEDWEENEWVEMEDFEVEFSDDPEAKPSKGHKKGAHRNTRKAIEDYLEKKRNLELYGDPFEDGFEDK